MSPSRFCHLRLGFKALQWYWVCLSLCFSIYLIHIYYYMFLALGCVTLPHTYLFLHVLRIEIHMFLCTYLSEWYFIYTVVLILWRCCCFFFVSLDTKDDISIGLVISFNCEITLTGANLTWCPALYMVRKVLNPRGLLRLLHSFGEHVLPFSLLFGFVVRMLARRAST